MSKSGRDPRRTHIPNFFESVTDVIQNDEERKNIIMSIYGSETENSDDNSIDPILEKLYQNAKNNASKKSKYGNRHDATIKNFAASLYCLTK